MSITDFLVWLSGGLGSTFIFSYIAERWAWFQAQKVNTKKFISTIGASILAILSYVTFTYVPSEVWVSLSPYWQIILGVIAINYGNQMFHQYDKELPSAKENAVG